MSKHTPGPWPSNEYTTSVFVPLKAIDCERIGFSIGFVNGHREKEAAANARLIAAAPDLLSALNAMLTHMGMDEDEWNRPTFNQARAAIAKATGEQP